MAFHKALFGIPAQYMTNVIGIELNVQWHDQLMCERAGGFPMVALVGDAAFQTHFWPGRGWGPSHVQHQGAALVVLRGLLAFAHSAVFLR